MPTQSAIDHQAQQLQLWRAQVRLLESQRAMHGAAFVPPSVRANIALARQEIAQCKAVLRGWSIPVEDLPEDSDLRLAGVSKSRLEYEPPLTFLEWLGGHRRKRHPLERRFLVEWVRATIFGWVSVGVATGYLQGKVLRSRMRSGQVDLLLFWTVYTLPISWLAPWATSYYDLGFWGGVLMGGLLGFMQWAGLRRVALSSGLHHWLFANGLAGGLALYLIDLEWDGRMPWFDLPSLLAMLTVFAAGTLFALITGVMLGWLLHHQPTDP